MNLQSFLSDCAAYNLWANQTLVEWLKTKPSDVMEREVASSFPTLKQTLLHIWDTQKWWLETLQQLNPESTYGRVFDGPADEVFDGIVKQSRELADYAATLAESALQEICQFSIPYVGDFSMTRFEMLQHCLNHSTYHRGQIVTIGRNVGLTDAPMTDYMFYLLRVKQEEA